jgi:phage replication O-like protein O
MRIKDFSDGYTKVPHKLYQAVCRYKTSGLKKDLIHAIIRYTFGFHLPEAELSIRFLAEYVDRPYQKVALALKELISANVVLVTRESNFNHVGRTLALNYYFESWEGYISPGKMKSLIRRRYYELIREEKDIPPEGVESYPWDLQINI